MAFPEVGPVTLCSQKKSSPFRTNFFARLGHGSVDNALLAPLAPCSDAPDAGHRHLATFYSLYVELRLCYHLCIEPRFQHQLGAVLVLQMEWSKAGQISDFTKCFFMNCTRHMRRARRARSFVTKGKNKL